MTSEQSAELWALIERVRKHQGNEPDASFCARWRKYVGTPDLWRRRLLARQFDQVDVPARIARLSEFLALLEGGPRVETIYEDLPFYQAFQKGVDRLEGKLSDRRILAVLGAIGVGKTYACIGCVRAGGPRKRVLVTIPDACRENKNAILQTLCEALGCEPDAPGALARFEALASNLSREPKTLILDEAHQGGVMLMRLVKDLVNRTRSTGFVYSALRTEFDRVRLSSRGAIIEAKQFLRRCIRPVISEYADGTFALIGDKGQRPGDVAVFLRRVTGEPEAECKRIAVAVLPLLKNHGNLSTLADAVESLEDDLDEGRRPTCEEIARRLGELCA